MYRYLKYIVFLTILLVVINANPRRFCGNNLTEMMSRFCVSFNTPGHRVRRQVIDDCCYNPCSVEYLLSNYCETYKSEALNKYLEQNQVNTEKAVVDESLQHDSPLGSFMGEINMLPQVRDNHRPRHLKRDQTQHAHNSQREHSSHHLQASHDLKRRKVKIYQERHKNYGIRNILNDVDLAKKTVPEAKLGQIEGFQRPFYVFNLNDNNKK